MIKIILSTGLISCMALFIIYGIPLICQTKIYCKELELRRVKLEKELKRV